MCMNGSYSTRAGHSPQAGASSSARLLARTSRPSRRTVLASHAPLTSLVNRSVAAAPCMAFAADMRCEYQIYSNGIIGTECVPQA